MSVPAAPDRLPRVLGPWVAAAVVVGTVIGSGVFKKPAVIADNVPTFGLALAAWVVMGVLAILGGLALAEVSVLYPRAGGNYVFLREGYGRMAGFLWGWVDFFVIRAATVAALATVFVESLHDFARQFQADPTRELLPLTLRAAATAGVIAALALVNARGAKWGGGLQLLLTVIKVAAIVVIALLPYVAHRIFAGAPDAKPEQLTPLLPADGVIPWSGFGAALIGALWSYHGWMNLGPVAEEVRQPQRNLPLAILGGIALVIVLYLAINVAFALVLSHDELKALKGSSVAAAACGRLLGTAGGALASLAVLASVFGSLNGNILVGARLPFAMADDGLAPQFLARVHPRYQTPATSLVALAAWSSLLVGLVAVGRQTGLYQAKKDPFDVMTDFAMFGAVCFETLAVASIFVFRRTQPDAQRSYRCVGYPVVPALYVLGMLGVLASYFAHPDKRPEAYSGLAFIAAGAVVYSVVFWRRK